MVMGIIRIILALMIVIYHLPGSEIFNFFGMNGSVAVKFFFIISGFYMSLVINEKYFVRDKQGYSVFITNRFLKLYPAYAVILLFALIVSFLGFLRWGNPIFLNSYFAQPVSITSLLILGLINISMFGIDIISFFGVNAITGQLFFSGALDANAINFIFIGQAWALSIELLFYLIAPFILRKNMVFLTGLLASSFLLRVILYQYGYYENPWADRFFPTELVFFMLGAIAYKMYSHRKSVIKNNFYFSLIPFGIISVIIIFHYIPDIYVSFFSLKEWLFYGIFTLSLPVLFSLSDSMKNTDRFFAELSYPIFLSHVVILNLVAIFINFNLDGTMAKTFVIVITILFSIIIIKFIMNPIEKIRQRRIKINEVKS